MTEYNNTSETLQELVTQSPSSFFTQVKNSVNKTERKELKQLAQKLNL